MSERKYLVPEEMLRAAWHAQLPADNPTFEWDEGDEISRKFYRRIFEAALRWLSDNPQVPTMEQATEMSDSGHPCVLDGVWYATEWQRRMFLAPETIDERDSLEQEESAYMRVTKAMGAVTLSEEEGNKILEFVKGAIHAEYRTPEPAVPNLKYCPTCGVDTTPLGVPFSHSSPWGRTMPGHTELEIPEAVKDLGCTPEQLATLDGVNKEIAIRANNAIAEAYRRGQKVGSRA